MSFFHRYSQVFLNLDYVGKVSYLISWCWAVYDVCCITNVY